MVSKSRLTLAAFSVVLVATLPVAADVPPPQSDGAGQQEAAPTPGTTPADESAPPVLGGATETILPDGTGVVVSDEKVKELLEADPRQALVDSLVARDGTIDLPGGQARVAIAEGFAFLDAADTKKLLTEIWGNPPQVSEGVLGAIIPRGVSVIADESWAAIITYSNDGHVADEDANAIDYDELLAEMQKETAAGSEERVKAGYEAISLVGWAQKPSYDAAGHKLHWAKHLQFGKDVHTLNYAIRALGRTGVLEVNVVADMRQLADVNAKVPTLLSMVSFNDGHRYADFQEGDPVAAYGIAALVAGGIAAKAGLFKGLLAILAASWKFIAIGVVALGGLFWRLFSGRSKDPQA